jgi:GNAT superfamily N-acetyltransferase
MKDPFQIRRLLRDEVGTASAQDAGAASEVLAQAFRDYPWTRWTVDATDHLDRLARLQHLALTELVLPFGEAWVATEADRIVSAALWMRPDRPVAEAVWRALEPLHAQLEGDRHAASTQAEALLAPHRPTTPHYYLGAVGTTPSHQRRGIGGALLGAVLDRLEREGAVACLETCGRDNVTFYAGLGFAVTAEIAIPSGGPTVWMMATRPRL